MDDPPKRILVVDDERVVRKLIQQALEAQGHVVITAQDGRDAIAILEREDFDRVYLDLIMPYLDGFEVLTWIRSQPTRAKTWVAIMTAIANEADSVFRDEVPADCYIQKPIGPADFVL